MKATQQVKLNMYRSIQQLCNDNTSIITTSTAFENAFKAFSIKVTNLINTATSEAKITRGIVIDKDLTKKTLCQYTTDLAAIVFAYANNTKNNTLKQAVNYSNSDLLHMKPNLLISTCNNIYTAANNNLAALASYNITAPILSILQTAIDNYSTAAPKPKTAKSLKATSTVNIKTLIKETDDILKNELDKLVVSFKYTNPDFVTAYKKTRTIIDPVTSTTQIKGTITNAATNNPVIAAKISITGTASAEATTDKAGNFTIKPIAPGQYKITITAKEYTDYIEENLIVKLGQATTVEIALKPV